MSQSRKLGFELLECRRVCAGDVTVSVVNGELKIIGDDAANFVDVQLRTVQGTKQFVVTGKAFNGSFTAAGDPVATGAATTINGESDPFQGAATKISVSMKEGNDAVVLGGEGSQFLVASLKVSTGTGSDYLKIKTARVSSTTDTAIQMTAVGGAAGAAEPGNDKVVLDGIQSPAAGADIVLGGGSDRCSRRTLVRTARARRSRSMREAASIA